MTPEGKVVEYVRSRVKELGGYCRKCSWEGRVGAPDLFVMLNRNHFWIECKAPGKEPRTTQLKEHELMTEIGGCQVYVADSVVAADAILLCKFHQKVVNRRVCRPVTPRGCTKS